MSFAAKLQSFQKAKKKKKKAATEEEPDAAAGGDASTTSMGLASSPPVPHVPPVLGPDDRLRMALEAEGPRLMQAKLREHGQRADDGRASSRDVEHDSSMRRPRRRNVALLFLVRDRMPHAKIWRTWIKEAARSGLEVGVFIHSHHPEALDESDESDRWVMDHRLPGKAFDTRWGSIALVKAELALLHEALSDRDVRYERFLFASETCLPVVHPAKALAALFGSGPNGTAHEVEVSSDKLGTAAAAAAAERSWVPARNSPNNGYSKQQQFDQMSVAIPLDCVWKADQWLALTRAHAAAVLTLPRSVGRQAPASAGLCDLFKRTTASDELYFPTMLALLGELPRTARPILLKDLEQGSRGGPGAAAAAAAAAEIPPPNETTAGGAAAEEPSASSLNADVNEPLSSQVGVRVAARRLTYCYWGDSPKSPEFLSLDAATVEKAVAEGCLFARKFSAEAVTYGSWRELVMGGSPKVEEAGDRERDGPRRKRSRSRSLSRSSSPGRRRRRSRSRSRGRG